MKRYAVNSICSNCKGYVESNFHEVVRGEWIKYSDHKAENNKLRDALEYYRRFMPDILGMEEEEYVKTKEAQNADEALKDGE